MKNVYIALAVLALAAGIFRGGMYIGKMGIVVDLSNQQVERQKKITQSTLRLAKQQKEIDAQSRVNQEVITNAKDITNCGSAVIPKSVIDLLRVR